MNDQSGFPNQGGMLPFGHQPQVPAQTGLRDLVVAGAAAPAAAQKRLDISEIWRVITKWWWLIAAIIVACLLAAVVLSLMVQPLYQARSTLEINREGVQVVEKMGELEGGQRNEREFMNTQAELLRSRALAERVARSLNLANNPALFDPATDRAAREQFAIGLVHGSVTIEPVQDSRLMQVYAVSTDPGLAAQIANAYGENFIQSNLERRFQQTSYARNFLEQRLASLKARLEDSERRLVAYAQREGIITLNVDSGDGEGGRSEQPLDATTLLSLNEALSGARSDRIAAEQRYRQAAGNRSTTEALNNPTIQTLRQQQAELQAEYQEKLGVFQPDYPAMVQLRSRIESIGAAIRREGGNVSGALQAEYAAAVGRENALQARVDALKAGLLNLRERSIQYTILQREVDTNRGLYDTLLQRYREVGVAGGVGTNAVSVVDAARVPGAPFKPNLPLNIALGLVAGLMLGFGAAFGLEWIDDTIKTPDDLTSKLGISPLGIIPAVARGSSVHEHLGDSRSQVSEAYHSVRTALQFSTDHGVPKTVLITSTRAAEGKSSSALAIAQTLSNLGASVLLVDADLRKPTFRAPSANSPGLSSLLAGSTEIQDCIHPTDTPGLFLLPSGPIPPNPAELLASTRLPAVMTDASARFDHVIVDGPPVLGLADAPLLSSICEGTLMVIEAGAIRRTAALNALNRLKSAGAHVMGGVLTKFSATKSGYGYGYGYGYGDDQYAYRQGDAPKKQIELLKSA
ncbi:GumC family protein [Allosphingosinicella sp.]|jgi:capsular exopolysaccharide synthesis family protein|uniref:GumC family protein n=1 Tax=Allosphingosinicella sp. TaxID=2823234 RepID=UPI002F250185